MNIGIFNLKKLLDQEIPINTKWASYTPVFQGFGTPSGIEIEWRQVCDTYEIRGRFTVGTPTAVEAQIGLPNGGIVSSSLVSFVIVGYGARGGNSTLGDEMPIATGGDSYINLAFNSSSSNIGDGPKTGAALFIATNPYHFFATVPIEGIESHQTIRQLIGL